jgi:hypothetical protein
LLRIIEIISIYANAQSGFLQKTYSSPLVINGGVKQKPTILPLKYSERNYRELIIRIQEKGDTMKTINKLTKALAVMLAVGLVGAMGVVGANRAEATYIKAKLNPEFCLDTLENSKYDKAKCYGSTTTDFSRKGFRIVHEVSTFSDLDGLSIGRKNSISNLYRTGITEGSPQGSNTYRPWDLVSRGAMAQFLYRAAQTPKIVKKVPNFYDAETGIAGRLEAINWLASEGITTGSPRGSNTYKPQDIVNRGAMAEFLYKFSGGQGAIDADPNSPNHHLDPSNPNWKLDGVNKGYETIGQTEKVFGGDADLQALKNTNPNRYWAIIWLAFTGIADGSDCNMDHNLFTLDDRRCLYKPNNPVNRGAMAEFIGGVMGLPIKN